MSEPFLTEIKIMSFNFPPKGWAFCNGQLMPINQNQAVFSLLGTTYGGNGQTNFALPDLRGRMPVGWGSEVQLGQAGGVEFVTVTQQTLPAHVHAPVASADRADLPSPSGARWADVGVAAFGALSAPVAMRPDAVAAVGGSQPHENRGPSLVLSFCIALQGIFPSQN